MNIEKIKVGDMIKYTHDTGKIKIRVVGGKRTGSYDYKTEAFLVDNNNLGKYQYSVYEDELLEHFTFEKNPEVFL